MKNFKILFLFMLALLCLSTIAFANKPSITSDNNYLDINTGRYILNGHVRIDTGSRVITADAAQVSITSLEVWGQGNITVTQDDIVFTGDKVYANGNNTEASIDGRVDLERKGLSITADSVKFNWDTKIAEFYDNVNANINGKHTSTNHLSYNITDNQVL